MSPSYNFMPGTGTLKRRPLRKSQKRKVEIFHYVQNDKKRQFVILEEPKATKDRGLCKGLFKKRVIRPTPLAPSNKVTPLNVVPHPLHPFFDG